MHGAGRVRAEDEYFTFYIRQNTALREAENSRCPSQWKSDKNRGGQLRTDQAQFPMRKRSRVGGAFRGDGKTAAGDLPYLQYGQHYDALAVETRLWRRQAVEGKKKLVMIRDRYYYREVNKMPYGFGRGGGYGRGFGGGMGFGFRGSSPPWPYVGRGRGGLPRCGYFTGAAGAPAPLSYNPPFYQGMPAAGAYPPYATPVTKEQELNYLKDDAEAIKSQLEEIESRMHDLEEDK